MLLLQKTFNAFPSYLRKHKQGRKPRKVCTELCRTSTSDFGDDLVSENSELPVRFNRKLEEINASHKKKIKALKQKARRYKQKIGTLMSWRTKKNLHENMSQVLSTTTPVNADLLLLQYMKGEGKKRDRNFPPALTAFALTFHYYFPYAYR